MYEQRGEHEASCDDTSEGKNGGIIQPGALSYRANTERGDDVTTLVRLQNVMLAASHVI